jgi:hypothetical protein
MADPEPRLVKESRCRDDLKKIMPFRIIPVDRKEREEIENNRTPLETALLFGLPEDVKQAISRMLTGSGNISLALLRTKKTGKQK